MRVMVVDDETAVARYLAAVCRIRGHDVQHFANAGSALQAMDSGDAPDIVVTDVTLNGMDGFELACRIAERLGEGVPRTLLVSGLSHAAELKCTPPSVAIGLLQKPFSFRRAMAVMDMIEKVRGICPGIVLRKEAASLMDHEDATQVCLSYRDSNYGECPHYNETCGHLLRAWITEG